MFRIVWDGPDDCKGKFSDYLESIKQTPEVTDDLSGSPDVFELWAGKNLDTTVNLAAEMFEAINLHSGDIYSSAGLGNRNLNAISRATYRVVHPNRADIEEFGRGIRNALIGGIALSVIPAALGVLSGGPDMFLQDPGCVVYVPAMMSVVPGLFSMPEALEAIGRNRKNSKAITKYLKSKCGEGSYYEVKYALGREGPHSVLDALFKSAHNNYDAIYGTHIESNNLMYEEILSEDPKAKWMEPAALKKLS